MSSAFTPANISEDIHQGYKFLIIGELGQVIGTAPTRAGANAIAPWSKPFIIVRVSEITSGHYE